MYIYTMGSFISVVFSRENLYKKEEENNNKQTVVNNNFDEYTNRDWIYYHMKRDNGIDILG